MSIGDGKEVPARVRRLQLIIETELEPFLDALQDKYGLTDDEVGGLLGMEINRVLPAEVFCDPDRYVAWAENVLGQAMSNDAQEAWRAIGVRIAEGRAIAESADKKA